MVCKISKHWQCMSCNNIIDNKIEHVRERHPDYLIGGKISQNDMKYMFLGVD
jgi:hypothetical protein